MRRRDFLHGLGVGAAWLGCFPLLTNCRASGPGRPNLILINVDDLGWTDLACFGSRYYETPNIDRMADQGIRFNQAYAACAVCSPTRAAIMTGRYPARLGLTDWIRARFQLHESGETFPADGRNPTGYEGRPDRRLQTPRNPLWMELEEVTVAEVLKSAGYATCHIGKWHLGYENQFPDKQGFDVNIGGCDKGQPPTYFDPYYSERYGAGNIPTLEPRKKGEYLTDREADEACRFIRGHAPGPFFLHLAHYAVHTPLEADSELLAKYRARSSPTAQKNPVYAAMVESVDRSVGRVLSTLDECGLSTNTLVVFTSDNGGLLGHSTDNRPLRSGKGYPYEGGIRVPQIMRWPGIIRAGTVTDVPVCSIDFFPTFCAAAGAAPPEGRAIDGIDLMPLITGRGRPKSRDLFWHFPHYRGGDLGPYSIVRRGDWKLIRRWDEGVRELYDLQDDLSETRDLAAELPEKAAELETRLDAWLESVGARLPRPNPDFAGEIGPPAEFTTAPKGAW